MSETPSQEDPADTAMISRLRYPILSTNIQRLLSWVRSKTGGHRHQFDGSDCRAPYCTDEKGNRLGLAAMARDLGWDMSNTGRYWKEAEKLGLVRRECRRLYLISNVPVPQEENMDKRGEELCAYHLDKPTQLMVKDFPKEKYAEFLQRWKSVDQYEMALTAQKSGEIRSEVAPFKDAIKRYFHLPVRRLRTRYQTGHIQLPSMLDEPVAQSSSLETKQNYPVAQTGQKSTYLPAGSDIKPDSARHTDQIARQEQPVLAQNRTLKGEQKTMTAKLPPELHLNAPKMVSDLRPRESGYVTFTEFNVSENGDCFLKAAAQVWNEAHASTVEVRRDEDGYHVIIPMSRKYKPGPIPLLQDNLPVVSVTIDPEEK
jgi:hypothetical protein